jgi:hypothetical protein
MLPENPLIRAVRNLTDQERMREVYTHQTREYTKKPHSMVKADAEDKAKRDILSMALGVDKETYDRWAKIVK